MVSGTYYVSVGLPFTLFLTSLDVLVNVERAFSSMNIIKTLLQNHMRDERVNNALVHTLKNIFSGNVENDDR